MVIHFTPATAAHATELRANLSAFGVAKARVRVMRNGAMRLVLASRSDRDAARDALVLCDARTAAGMPFTNPDSACAWNGPVEVFVRFVA